MLSVISLYYMWFSVHFISSFMCSNKMQWATMLPQNCSIVVTLLWPGPFRAQSKAVFFNSQLWAVTVINHKLLSILCDTHMRNLFQFRLLLAEDGSGKGAGLVAAIALRLKQRFSETWPTIQHIAIQVKQLMLYSMVHRKPIKVLNDGWFSRWLNI
jgi:hypothetical protein